MCVCENQLGVDISLFYVIVFKNTNDNSKEKEVVTLPTHDTKCYSQFEIFQQLIENFIH